MGKRKRKGAPNEPGVHGRPPRRIRGIVHGEIRLGNGPPSGAPPASVAFPGGPFVLASGAPIAPLVPSVANQVERWFVGPALPNASLPAITLAPAPRVGVLAPDNPAPIAYKPPEATLPPDPPLPPIPTPAGLALLDVYLPAGTPPAGGWPVLLTTRIAGWFGAPVRGAIDPAQPFDLLLHKALNAGLAVLDVGANSSGTTGNFVRPAWFYPPGHPSGRWDDERQTLPDKDVVHAIQWTKDQSLFPLDPERIFLLGFSAGAQIALWIAFHPDLASSSGSSQIRRDTSVAGVVAFDPVTSFLAQRDDWPIANARFESVASPGQDALDLADADPLVRDQAAPLRALLRDTSRAPLVACFLACDEALGSSDFALAPDDHPVLRNALGEPDVHDLWNAAMLSALLRLADPDFHQAQSALWVHAPFAPALGVLQPLVSGTFAGDLVSGVGSGPFWDTVIAWLVARASEARLRVDGLQLHPRRGVIHGRPNLTQAASTHFVVARNEFGSAHATITLAVEAPPVP